MAATGAMNMQARNMNAAVRLVRPVRPPASTPEADSTNVVTVDVPQQAPATVPTAKLVSRLGFRAMMYAMVMKVVRPARISVLTVVPFSFRWKMRSIVIDSPFLRILFLAALFCAASNAPYLNAF